MCLRSAEKTRFGVTYAGHAQFAPQLYRKPSTYVFLHRLNSKCPILRPCLCKLRRKRPCIPSAMKCPFLCKLHRHQPCLGIFRLKNGGRNPSNLAEAGSKFDDNRRDLPEFGPNLADFGQIWHELAKFDICLPKSGSSGRIFGLGPLWAERNQIRPTSPKFGRNWGQIRSTSSQTRRTRAQLRPKLAAPPTCVPPSFRKDYCAAWCSRWAPRIRIRHRPGSALCGRRSSAMPMARSAYLQC